MKNSPSSAPGATMKRWKPNLPEIHIAILGANGSGKSALTVKYITKHYITVYDPFIEDTYCKRDTISSKEYMVWIMDTVEGQNKDPNRYLSWADIFLIVYDITDKSTFDYAGRLLNLIKHHEHSCCSRQHFTHLIGNKCDLERYRQVSKMEGLELAEEHSADFWETNCTEQYGLVKTIFNQAIEKVASTRKSRMSRTLPAGLPMKSHNSSSDSDKSAPHSASSPSFFPKSRTKSPSAKSPSDPNSVKHAPPTPTEKVGPKRSNAGLKWIKNVLDRGSK